MGYEKKFRDKALQYLSAHTYRQASEVFGISPNTLNRWRKKLEQTGNLEDFPQKKYYRKINPQRLRELVEKEADMYQFELAKHFGCTQQSIFVALKRLGITRKKRQSDIMNKTLKK